jgi:hypothetical protein
MRWVFVLTALILLISAQLAHGLDTATRLVGPVRSWDASDLEQFNSEWVQVKFAEGSDIRMVNGGFVDDSGRNLSLVNTMIGHPSVIEIRPTFNKDRATLRAWKTLGEERSGAVGPDLSLWFNLRVRGGRSKVARLINELNSLPVVEISHPVPIVEPAVLQTSDKRAEPTTSGRVERTPDFTNLQDYLYDPPVGLDGPAAWAIAGGYGELMKFIDVELCWTEDHEDFDFDQFFYEGGYTQDPGYETHGTAVLGEVIGQHNEYGISGFAPAVNYGVVAIDIGLYPDAAQYFQEALDHLDTGDVWLIELQMYPPDCGATPMEWLQVNYDVIWTSSWAREVVCVEAGANGSQDLDDPSWEGVFDREQRDSGAIMVAAGTPTGRVAEWFTNYGSRMDVHAWGSQIVTTGYGDLYDGGSLQTRYTSTFGGTSGASPMIVGSSLCLQGIAKAHLAYPLTPELLRSVLHDTGIPHLDPTKEIGPRPDLAAAAEEVLMLSPSPYLAISSLEVDDDDVGLSQGNDNNTPEFSETIELTITLENVGQLDAPDVLGQLLSADEFVTVIVSEASFGTIPGGGGTGSNAIPFVFSISSEVPDQHEVAFQLAINAPPDTLNFALVIGAPVLSVVAFQMSDDVGGNGNGIPEPGEDVVLDITVANQGSAAVTDVWGTLSGGPYLDIDPTPVAFGQLDPETAVTGGPFAVAISPNCPDPFTTLLTLSLEGSGAYAHADVFSFNIGDLFCEDMEDGGASWSHYPASAEYGDEWHLETYRNHTYGGTTSWKCGGAGAADYDNNLYAMLESSPFVLPANASLTFWHWIDAEVSGSYPGYCYDGGLVEISIDGGEWEQITPVGGYPYLMRPGSNPLPENTPVFSGSHDWEEVPFDLAEYQGSGRIRFVFATDAAATQEGWYVDDVQLFRGFSAAGDRSLVEVLLLHPAHPNPAANHTTLQLDLPQAGPARVCIYDAAGRRLRTLVDARLPAGQHPLTWDGRDAAGNPAAAGVYWALVQADDQQRSARIVLVR